MVWLAVLVLGHLEVIAANEDVLQKAVLLAAFIPLLGGTGGNVGAQSSTVVIRGLSTQSISTLGLLKAIGREAMVVALLGVLMMLLVVLSPAARGKRVGGPFGGHQLAGDHHPGGHRRRCFSAVV